MAAWAGSTGLAVTADADDDAEADVPDVPVGLADRTRCGVTVPPWAMLAAATAMASGLTVTWPCPNESAARFTPVSPVGTFPLNAGVPRVQGTPTPSEAAAWARSDGPSREDSPMNAVLHDCAKSRWKGTVPRTSWL